MTLILTEIGKYNIVSNKSFIATYSLLNIIGKSEVVQTEKLNDHNRS